MTRQRGSVDAAFWSGRRVFVTGHTGFKGSWLCAWLTAMDADVTGYSDRVPTSPSLFEIARVHEDVRDVRGDVADGTALATAVDEAQPEIVFHLAAQSLVRTSYREPLETFRTNVMGTAQLLEAVRVSESVRVAVVVTSDKCYENQNWPWGYREPEPLGGHDPYSSSKAAAELVTAAYRNSFLAERDVRTATARAGNVIGGGDWSEDRLIPDLMRAALSGGQLSLRHPSAIRPWQHVLDCLSGYLVLGQGLWKDPALQGAWNFGPSQHDERSVRDVVDSVAALWPQGIDVRHDDRPAPHEAARLSLDSAKARDLLGWRPTWDVEAATRRVVEWYLAFAGGADMAEETRRQLRVHAQATEVVTV